MSNPDVRLNRLPVFDNHDGRPERWTGLRVDGLVAEPRTFSAMDLEAFADAPIADSHPPSPIKTPVSVEPVGSSPPTPASRPAS
jgi:hypothetical protein